MLITPRQCVTRPKKQTEQETKNITQHRTQYTAYRLGGKDTKKTPPPPPLPVKNITDFFRTPLVRGRLGRFGRCFSFVPGASLAVVGAARRPLPSVVAARFSMAAGERARAHDELYIRRAWCRWSGGRRTLDQAMDSANRVVAAATDHADVVPVAPPRPQLPSLLLTLSLALALAATACRRRVRARRGNRNQDHDTLDGPAEYPMIGAMHVMRGYQHRPFRRFTELSRQYGPVYRMLMGATPCVVVNDYASIREVLITNGSKFGGRLDFDRYNALFAGNRNNCEYRLYFNIII